MFDSPFYNYRESFDRGKIVIVTAFFFFCVRCQFKHVFEFEEESNTLVVGIT